MIDAIKARKYDFVSSIHDSFYFEVILFELYGIT